MEGDHSLLWQTGSMPKARCGLLRGGIQVDVWAGIAWLT
jgi:hypothetical protein